MLFVVAQMPDGVSEREKERKREREREKEKEEDRICEYTEEIYITTFVNFI